MNDVFFNIYLRRSIRDYKDREVSEQIIKELVKAGTYAPSAMNRQPWRFVIVQNRDTIRKYSDIALRLWLESQPQASENPAFKGIIAAMSNPDFNIFYNAPLVMFIFANPEAMSPEYDCAMAAQNIMLGARSLGIGSCWIGMAAPLGMSKQFMNEVGVPEDHRLISSLALGFPAKQDQLAPQGKRTSS